jgi:hypothetical protein
MQQGKDRLGVVDAERRAADSPSAAGYPSAL